PVRRDERQGQEPLGPFLLQDWLGACDEILDVVLLGGSRVMDQVDEDGDSVLAGLIAYPGELLAPQRLQQGQQGIQAKERLQRHGRLGSNRRQFAALQLDLKDAVPATVQQGADYLAPR